MNILKTTFNEFLITYQQYHSPVRPSTSRVKNFIQHEKSFLASLGIGLFETYHFLYSECRDAEHFKEWLIQIRGEAAVKAAEIRFNRNGLSVKRTFNNVLSTTQLEFWKENGFIKISGLVADEDCDAVNKLICDTLGVNLSDSASWYPNHQIFQGLMVQLYQGEALSKVRSNKSIRDVFRNLYGSTDIIANCDKVSYNPPITDSFRFMGSPLHWDIDFAQNHEHYIQGLVYLDDVPENRGPIHLIPGFHSCFDQFMSDYASPDAAIESLRHANAAQPVPGKKGDLILWLNTIPHAATPNHSDLPRFVQYVSYHLSGQANPG